MNLKAAVDRYAQGLTRKTEVFIGLAAAIAMNCAPYTRYYLDQAKKQTNHRLQISWASDPARAFCDA